MKEIPCKGCIIQPVCTKKCNAMSDYRDHYLIGLGALGNSKIYIEYYIFTQLILNRRRQTQLTEENKP